MFLIDGPDRSAVTVLLAHGAGAPMDSASLNAITKALVGAGLAARRDSSTRRPPPRAEALMPEYIAAVEALRRPGPLIIGGKSLGGRVASMIADQLRSDDKVAGLLCLGYPFHPIGKPGQLRTAHLADIQTPTLIVQGTRDPLGNLDEVATYKLSRSIQTVWLEDGDHDLKPRKSVSGFTAADHMQTMSQAVAAWEQELLRNNTSFQQ